MGIALIIFILTYVIIAIQNMPKVHINRPAGALLGPYGLNKERIKKPNKLKAGQKIIIPIE